MDNKPRGELKLSKFADWLADKQATREWVIKHHPESLKSHDEYMANRMSDRATIQDKFPFVVCVEAYEPVLSYASRWCWRNIGPCDGPCGDHYEEYPGCPLVLATEYIERGSYPNTDGSRTEWEEKAYKDPGEHTHDGSWVTICLGKTGYDYFVIEFCFETEEDRQRFLAARPSFHSGEKYHEE